MRRYLLCIFMFGWLFGLVEKFLRHGSINIYGVSGAAGVGILFLSVATLIVRPWRQRNPPIDNPPPFRAASITIFFMMFFILVDVFSNKS